MSTGIAGVSNTFFDKTQNSLSGLEYWKKVLFKEDRVIIPKLGTHQFQFLESCLGNNKTAFNNCQDPIGIARLECAFQLYTLLPKTELSQPLSKWNSSIPISTFESFTNKILSREEDRKNFIISIYLLVYAYESVTEIIAIQEALNIGRDSDCPKEKMLASFFNENEPVIVSKHDIPDKLLQHVVLYFYVVYQITLSQSEIFDIMQIFFINSVYITPKDRYSCFDQEKGKYLIADPVNYMILRKFAWFHCKNLDIPKKEIIEKIKSEITRKIPNIEYDKYFADERVNIIWDIWSSLGDMVYTWLQDIYKKSHYQKKIAPYICELSIKHSKKSHQIIIDELNNFFASYTEEEAKKFMKFSKLKNKNYCSWLATCIYKIWWYTNPYSQKMTLSVYHRAMEYVVYDLFAEEDTSSKTKIEILNELKLRCAKTFPAFVFDEARAETLIFEYSRNQ